MASLLTDNGNVSPAGAGRPVIEDEAPAMGDGDECPQENTVQVDFGRPLEMENETMSGFRLIASSCLAALEAQLVELQAKQRRAQLARDSLTQVLSDYVCATPAAGPGVTVEELEVCGSQPAGLKLIAQRSGGRIKLSEAVKLIHETSLTTAKVPGLRATLHRYLKSSSDWIDEGNGYFTLKGAEKPNAGWTEGVVRIHHPGGEYTHQRFRVGPAGEIILEEMSD